MTTLIPKYDLKNGGTTPTGAINRPFNEKLNEVVSVKDFGAIGDGSTDDTVACQNAINAVRNAGGGTVFFPAGTYLLNGQVNTNAGADSTLNGLLIPYTNPNGQTGRILIRGAGQSTILKAGSNSMYVIRLCDSHCGVEHLTIDGNSKTSVYGIGLVPENIATNATIVFQTYNTFFDLYLSGLTEGVIFRCGVPVSGADSGCWYNNFTDIYVYYCTRGLWFAGTTGHSAGNNRNNFNNVRIGQNTNTAIQIDEGGTNMFFGVHMEGVTVGTSPNTNPTGIKIAASGASGADNNSNKFFGCIQEACTVSLVNANRYSEFYGCEFSSPYSMVLTAKPKVMVGSDASQNPQIGPWGIYQTNGEIAGYINGLTLNGGVKFDLNGSVAGALNYSETSGSTSVANGATFNITVPQPRKYQLLSVYSSNNLSQGVLALVHGDGSGNITINNIVNDSGAALSSTGPATVQVTNNYGLTSNISWSLTPISFAV